MTVSALEKLPIGLITDIAKLLTFDDIKNLSCVSWVMRDAVLRLLFRTLSITCPVDSDRDLDRFIDKYKELISRLHLHIKLGPNPDEGSDYDSDEEQPEAPSIWGTSSRDTVKNIVRGQVLSHINTLSVRLDPDQFEEDGDWDDEIDTPSIHVFAESEDWDRVHRREGKYFWRAQCTEVWNEIAANPNINSLRISNLLPKNSSAWLTNEWKDFLGRLKDLDVSVFGADNGAGWKAHKMPGFYDFITTLPELMMQHASNVTRLRLEANEEGLLGSTSEVHDVPLPLENGNMPSLRILQLENIMLGNEVLDFIRHHANTLQEIHLRNCMCDRSEHDPSWSDLWKLIREVTTAVTEVSFIQGKTPPLARGEEYGDSVPTREDSDAGKKVRKQLAEDKSLVLWRYVYVDDKYGMIFEQYEDNIECFEQGNDQLEYTRLLDELSERRQKAL
ncbi:hypothetical protein ACHAPJ_010922 [Fusarium lateritium]